VNLARFGAEDLDAALETSDGALLATILVESDGVLDLGEDEGAVEGSRLLVLVDRLAIGGLDEVNLAAVVVAVMRVSMSRRDCPLG
jgi:hypothetical protein